MVKEIIQIGNPLLGKVSEVVTADELNSKSFKELLKDLRDTVSQKGLNSVGLSAVQIGVLKRVFISRRVDLSKNPESGPWEVFINPKLSAVGVEQSTMWEGCLSIGTGKSQLFGPVTRAAKVKVDYIDMHGATKSVTADDYMAHVLQHELDHLNGVLFLKHIQNPKNIWRSDALDKYLTKYGDYPELAA
jgi:peptide deformylase